MAVSTSNPAYGFIEISGVTAAVTALDLMCKTAGVTLVTWEKKWGGRLVTVIVAGDISQVQAAVTAAQSLKPAASGVIPSPHNEIVRMVNASANTIK